MNYDERQFLIAELSQAREFVEQNWSDDLGKQFTAWVSQTEAALKQIQQRSETCRQQAEKIWNLCQETIDSANEDPNDPEKILRLERKPYFDAPGRSR